MIASKKTRNTYKNHLQLQKMYHLLVNEEISRREFDLEDLSQELLKLAAIGGQVNKCIRVDLE